MPSPADRPRIEGVLRATALVLLAIAAWGRLTPAPVAARAGNAADTAALAAWTLAPRADTLAVSAARPPGPAVTAWLGALRGAGDAVEWTASFAPLAIAVEPRADPAGGALVSVAGPPGGRLVLSDGLGALDSGAAAAGGVAFTRPAWSGTLSASSGPSAALVADADTAAVRHAVVLGRAGWESRFVVTALEERGWAVDVRLVVAPGIAIDQGRPLPLDTAIHAVVLVLDSLEGPDAVAVARFVAAGGGAVIGPGSATGALAAIAPAREAARIASRLPRVAGMPSADLARRVLQPRHDAVVLERAGGAPVVAARRAGAGRVVQVGYEDTWRRRMSGGAEAVDAHRDWWSDVVAAVARVPSASPPRSPADDPAPMAALAAALGPAAADAAVRHGGGPDPRRLLPAAVLAALACLLGEWLSRRLRGAA